MKKSIYKVLSILVFVLVGLAFAVIGLTKNISDTEIAENDTLKPEKIERAELEQKIKENGGSWTDSNGFIHYLADTNYRDGWQLTEDELNADTETLLDLVINSDFLKECVISFSSTYEGYISKKEAPASTKSYLEFNGYIELLSRSDFKEVFTSRYAKEKEDYYENGWDYEFLAMEELLIQPAVKEKIQGACSSNQE